MNHAAMMKEILTVTVTISWMGQHFGRWTATPKSHAQGVRAAAFLAQISQMATHMDSADSAAQLGNGTMIFRNGSQTNL